VRSQSVLNDCKKCTGAPQDLRLRARALTPLLLHCIMETCLSGRRHGEGGRSPLPPNAILATFPNRPDPLSFLRGEESDVISLLQTQTI